jgi:hypothetical protein
LNHEWGEDKQPGRVPKNRWFSIEWSGSLTPPAAGLYKFRLFADDVATLFLNNRQVIRAAKLYHPGESVSGEMELSSGACPIRVEYANWGGVARIRVEWKKLGQSGFDWCEIEKKYLSPYLPGK